MTLQANFTNEQIGSVSLILGDSFKVVDSFPDNYFDAADTSPPFENDEFDVLDDETYYSKLGDFILMKLRYKVRDYSLVFNSSTRLVEMCKRYNPSRVLTWYKLRSETPYRTEPVFVFPSLRPRYNFNKSCFSDGYHVQAVAANSPNHNYENPVELHEVWLLNILTFRGASRFTRRVLDPFAGSGCVGKACLDMGLECVLIERDPTLFEKTSRALKEWRSLPINPRVAERIAEAKEKQRTFTEGGLP